MNVSVDLAPNQLEFLEKLVKTGDYRSRSEAVRDILRRAEFAREWKRGIEDAARKGVSPDIEEAREHAYRRLKKGFKNAL